MTNQRADQAKTGPAAASWWLPSLPVWIFVVLLTWLFHYAGAAQQLLGDGDAGWHILTGEYVLNHLALPATDPFSFTMEGRAWYAWEWLADVVFALAHRFDGLEGVVLLTGAVIAATGALTLRFLLWSGANLFLAALGSIFVSAVSTSHWLARPHIFTWGLFIATLWLLESDRRANSWRIWLLAPLGQRSRRVCRGAGDGGDLRVRGRPRAVGCSLSALPWRLRVVSAAGLVALRGAVRRLPGGDADESVWLEVARAYRRIPAIGLHLEAR
jgi:hypothetical protein